MAEFHLTDSIYEDNLRDAEKAFIVGSADWLERLVAEAKKLPYPKIR